MGIINKTTDKINSLLDKVEKLPEEGIAGKTPVLEIGFVTTVSAGSSADVNIRDGGLDENGNPIYLLDFDIPKGKDGTSTGEGGEPVTIDWDSVLNKPTWVESQTKPTYNAQEVGALPSDTSFKTINGESILGEGDIEIQGGTSGGVGQNYPGYNNAEIFNDYDNNKAMGAHAHAEGSKTNATGSRAHAEGYLTNVFAADAHAEGRETWCTGGGAHVEGFQGFSMGSYSHVEGCAEKIPFTVEDEKKYLNDEESVRLFLDQYAFQQYNSDETKYYWMLAENIRDLFYLHAALGISCHCEGINNIVCDKAGHVEGYDNMCGDRVPGHGQDSTVYAPHAEGIGNVVASLLMAPHVGGGYNQIKSGNYTFAHGFNLIVENDYEAAFGKYNVSMINGKKVLFSYGVGDTEDRRENALSILEDGSVVIPSLINDSLTNELQSYKIEIEAKLSNAISSLTKKLQEQDAKIEHLISLIQSGDYAKAFVVGDTLVFNKNADVQIESDTLVITDESITVSDKILTIN